MLVLKICLVFILKVVICNSSGAGIFRQEGAKVTYVNDKYVANVTMFTYRTSRKSPYLTSVNGTTLHSWANNISLVLEYGNLKERVENYVIEGKLCELMKFDWIKEFAKKYSNVDPECPIPAGRYTFQGFELPPKKFPMPVSKGDYHVRLAFLISGSKTELIEFQMNLRYQNKKT